MKARPILFNGDMVRALIDGRKTQTRRVMKPQPEETVMHNGKSETASPYGKKGDMLWVRETFVIEGEDDYEPVRLISHYRADGADLEDTSDDRTRWKPSIHMPRWASRLTLEITDIRVERMKDISEADAIAEGATFTDFGKGQYGQQRPGWSMENANESDRCLDNARLAFGNYVSKRHGGKNWNLKNETPLFDINPWVWVIEFKVHHQNIDDFMRTTGAND